MAKTRRYLPSWAKDLDKRTRKKLEYARRPSLMGASTEFEYSGFYAWESVWNAKAKRFLKRMLNKKNRKQTSW